MTRISTATWLGLMLMLLLPIPASATRLTLAQAEHIALIKAPELKQLQAKHRAIGESAVAAGKLADPKLSFSAMNLPTDTFDLGQEPMTQLQVGLKQSFPRGRSLHYRSQKKQKLARAEYEKNQVMQRHILRSVRLIWVHLYYWTQAKKIVFKQKHIFKHLLDVNESLLANNKAHQKDVIRTQLEISNLANQLIQINQEIQTVRAELARYIGLRMANKAQPNRLPKLANIKPLPKFKQGLTEHPELKVDRALIAASRAGIKLAKQQYWPGFDLSVDYGFRQGRNIDGGRRADFLSAQISIDLPLFPKNRQNRELKASQFDLIAAHENQNVHYRELLASLRSQYIAWQQLQKSATLYQNRLIPQAQQYAQATLVAYENNQTDFPTLARSYLQALDTKLAGLKVNVAKSQAQINLLYLEGK